MNDERTVDEVVTERKEIVKTLLTHGADPNAISNVSTLFSSRTVL